MVAAAIAVVDDVVVVMDVVWVKMVVVVEEGLRPFG